MEFMSQEDATVITESSALLSSRAGRMGGGWERHIDKGSCSREISLEETGRDGVEIRLPGHGGHQGCCHTSPVDYSSSDNCMSVSLGESSLMSPVSASSVMGVQTMSRIIQSFGARMEATHEKSILKKKPGGEFVIKEYSKTKSLTDCTRRKMINILDITTAQCERNVCIRHRLLVLIPEGSLHRKWI
ncbi:unnamed protein product, partial [Coregonus sp. 'balchen']